MIESLSENDAACQRLMTVPGIGPIISSAVAVGPVGIVGRAIRGAAIPCSRERSGTG